jgi:hypothetical protein
MKFVFACLLTVFLSSAHAQNESAIFFASGKVPIMTVDDLDQIDIAYGGLCWTGENTLERAIEVAQRIRQWTFQFPSIEVRNNLIWAFNSKYGGAPTLAITYTFEQSGLDNIQSNRVYLTNCQSQSTEFFE